MAKKSNLYFTSFCNHNHRLSDGKPVNHECYVMPTEALHAEKNGDVKRAQDILAGWKKRKEYRGVK